MRSLTISKTITDKSDMSLSYFLRDISKIPLLSVKEEVEAAIKARDGDKKAIDLLIVSNLKFVVSIAKQYQHKGLPLVDLIQAGILGLVESVSKYDVTKGFKFISYAVWWIRQSIILALSNESRTVRVPTNQINFNSKINKVVEKYEQVYNRPPSNDEIVEETELSEERVKNALTAITKSVSFDTPFKEGESDSLYDVIPTEIEEADLDGDVRYRELEKCLKKLSNREGDIIRMFYGIGMDSLSYEEIAERFGLGEERVRQLHHSGLDRLYRLYRNDLKDLL